MGLRQIWPSYSMAVPLLLLPGQAGPPEGDHLDHRLLIGVRRPDGGIETEVTPVVMKPWQKWPFVRGIYNMAENLVVGYRCLMRSADISMTEEEKVVAVKARALGMMRIYRRVPYGDAKTQELCLEKMIEYIADGVMGKEEDKEEEE